MKFCFPTTPNIQTSHSLRPLLHLIVVITLASMSLFLLPSEASGQAPAPFDLSISPAVVQIILKPGKTVTQAFLLENSGSVDLTVKARLNDFRSNQHDGTPELLETLSFPFAKLENADVQLGVPFVLKAQSSQQLVLALTPPESAPAQDWYGALVLETQPTAGTLGSDAIAASARGNISALLITTISPTDQIPHQWSMSLAALPRWIDSLQPLIFTVPVKNIGNTVGQPDIRVLVLDWGNNIVYEADGLPDRILAQSQRNIQAAKTDPADPRSFIGVPFTFDPLFALGPYTVRVTLRNQDGGPITTETVVRAYPFSLILAGGTLGAACWVLFWLRRRQIQRIKRSEAL